MALSGRPVVGSAPVPTLASVLAGTLVMSCATAGGRLEEPRCLPGLARSLTRISTMTMTSTRPTELPTISSLRRCSALLAAACCTAMRSRALRALFLSALPIDPALSLQVRGRDCLYPGERGPADDQSEQDKRQQVHSGAVQADRVDPEQLGPDQIKHENYADDHGREPGPVHGWPARPPGPGRVCGGHEDEESQAENGYRQEVAPEQVRPGACGHRLAVDSAALRAAGECRCVAEVLVGQVCGVAEPEHGDDQRREGQAAAGPADYPAPAGGGSRYHAAEQGRGRRLVCLPRRRCRGTPGRPTCRRRRWLGGLAGPGISPGLGRPGRLPSRLACGLPCCHQMLPLAEVAPLARARDHVIG